MGDFFGLSELDARLNGVQVVGLRETMRDLRLFSPDLYKEMNEEVKEITQPFVSRAKIFAGQAGRSNGAPLSRWNYQPRRPGSRGQYAPLQGKSGFKAWEYDRLKWNTGKVKSGIRSGPGGLKFRSNVNLGTSDRWNSLWSIRNANAAGAVYELMGTGAAQTPMARTVPRVSGYRGKRLIWRAWNDMRGDTTVPMQIEKVIVAYTGRFNAGLRTVGPRRPMRKRKTYTPSSSSTV